MRRHPDNKLPLPSQQLTLQQFSQRQPSLQQKGAALIVLLVVLILGSAYLLVGRLNVVAPVLKQNNTTSERLNTIRAALLGYAVVHGRLPCPDISGDGHEDTPCTSTDGVVPWLDLGVQYQDAWGHAFRYRANNNFTLTPPVTNTTSGNLRVTDLAGTVLTSTDPAAPAAIIYSCGADGIPNDENDVNGVTNTNATCDNPGTGDTALYVQDVMQSNFDDVLVWLTKAQLQARMTAAGNWPP